MIWCPLLVLLVAVSPRGSSQSPSSQHREVENEPERYKVVVVGAGVSGFTAAATLLENNLTDLTILEGADRIGGRIHTVQFGGVPMDKGAEFVEGEVGNAVFELVSPYKDRFLASYIPLTQADKMMFVNSLGKTFNSSFVSELLDKASDIQEEKDIHFKNGSFADYFYPRFDEMVHSLGVDPKLAEAVRYLITLRESAADAADMSQLGPQGVWEYDLSEGDPTIKWKTGGYRTVFDFLSKKFPNPEEELPVLNKTQFNKQVTTISRSRRGGDVEVKCADGSTYLADHVIVSTSLGVLKKHAASMFHPPLSKDRTKAIETLGFGTLGKVFLLFPTRWWPKTINAIVPMFSKEELQDFRIRTTYGSWTSNTSGFYPVLNHDRMLCVWFSGEVCRTMEALPEERVVDGLMELLDKLVGDKFQIPRPEAVLRSGWGSNPYTLGSYSFRTVESDSLNITNDDLAKPVLDDDNKPVILFAGEATNRHSYATVHGALASGRREALNLLAYLRVHGPTATEP